MRNSKRFWFILGFVLLVDVYVFSVLQSVTQASGTGAWPVVYVVYWAISLLAVGVLAAFPYVRAFQKNIFFRNNVFAIVIGIYLAKIAGSAFFLVDDLRRGGLWLVSEVFHGAGSSFFSADGTIHRSAILSWMGLGVGGGLFTTLLYGFSNKYNYQVKKVKLFFKNLPPAFKGLKIVQLSDIHSGSLQNREAVSKGVDRVLAEKPDLILFTGDLVNDRAEELAPFTDIFSRLKAPMGVYSVLGNHDYGDYYAWPDKGENHRAAEIAAGRHLFTPLQTQSIEKLKTMQAQMGWRLLMNEHVVFEKGGQQIALLGIENWGGKGNFAKYGRMDLAYAGTERYPFKILMSHDPSHWDVEVRPKYPDIDLALAGHTHGMQFGIELPRVKWSPVQWMYKNWAGLYEEGEQKLYVNRGFGFIGYPGRVGILPEITVIELE